ncbi:MAG TPA: hypothetical protein VFI25_11175 [Planctomycetota bacterium]|jgi:hypothetical protein|nr:hypothetical protein [Planctomycetota bacterium]
MNGRSPVFLAALLSPLLAPAAAAQKRGIGAWHNDKKHGFAVRVIESIATAIPLQPNEEYEIAKFSGPRLSIGKENAEFTADFRILRIEPKGPATGSMGPGSGKEGEPESRPDPEKAKREYLESRKARTFEQWLKEQSGFMNATVADDKKKDFALPSKLPATEYEFTVKTQGKTLVCGYAAVVHMTGQEIALVWLVPENHYDKWIQPFKTAARTFKPIEKEAAVAEAGAGLSEREKKKRELIDRHKTLAGWTVDETEHYFIVSDADPKHLPEVKRRIEAIRGRLEKDFPPEKPIAAVSTLRVCKNGDEYHQYGGPGGSAGYWNDQAEELVIYVVTEKPSDTWCTMQHEAFHQYIYYRCGELAPHSWYNEGTGDYYAGADFKYGKFEIDIFDWRKDPIRQAIRDGKHVPLAEILKFTKDQYYAKEKVGICYAEGWSFIYFLREGKKKGAKNWNPAWEKILPTYLEKLIEAKEKGESEARAKAKGEIDEGAKREIQEQARKTALDAAFEGIDVEALEKAWMEFTT